MYVQVTEAHIRLGQSYPAGMTRGESCPIAWAIRDALGSMVSKAYVGPMGIEVRWSGGVSTVYSLDEAGFALIVEADQKGEGRTDIEPRVVRLDSHPLPVAYKEAQRWRPLGYDVNEEVDHG